MSAQIADEPCADRPAQVRETERALRRVQLLDRPDAEEREDGRTGDRPHQADSEDRAQGAFDVVASDQAKNT
jgi:hypothetical protein